MDFSLGEDQKMLRGMVREFAEKELEPIAAKTDEEARFPASAIKKAAEIGLMGTGYPENYGGSGGGAIEQAIVFEEVARACAATSVILIVTNELAAYPVYQFGTEDQKKKYLLPLLRGEKLGAFGLTEAGAGSDVAALSTSAAKKNGGYMLNGNKVFISNGAEAEIIIVFATVDRAKGYRGVTAFIVEKGANGFAVGKHERKLGIRGSSTTELIFDNCFVPEENRLGPEGKGFHIALETIDGSRIGIAAQAVGIGQAALEKSLAYAKERKQFGQAIANFQAVQWMLADMGTRLDAARLLTYRAAYLKDQRQPFIKEACMAKVYAAEAASFIATKALQIYGGYGYVKDFPIERYFRDARITEIYEGTSEMQRMTIARQMIKGE
ncbi:MAG: acyl-CoA dehydrogenase family protein [Dehalococcoidia bacterium]|nr:acyl-CoA dehydrogenase family protein [Dehalococcoidia bacterium]